MENQLIRFKLRTLLIVLALGPPLLAGAYLMTPKIIDRYRQWQFDSLIRRMTESIRIESRWEHWDDDGEPVSPVEPDSQ